MLVKMGDILIIIHYYRMPGVLRCCKAKLIDFAVLVNRWTYWLLWLCCFANGYRARYCDCRCL